MVAGPSKAGSQKWKHSDTNPSDVKASKTSVSKGSKTDIDKEVDDKAMETAEETVEIEQGMDGA